MFKRPIKKVFLYGILLLLFVAYSYISIGASVMESGTLMPIISMVFVMFFGIVISLVFQFFGCIAILTILKVEKRWRELYTRILQLMTLRGAIGFFIYLFANRYVAIAGFTNCILDLVYLGCVVYNVKTLHHLSRRKWLIFLLIYTSANIILKILI